MFQLKHHSGRRFLGIDHLRDHLHAPCIHQNPPTGMRLTPIAPRFIAALNPVNHSSNRIRSKPVPLATSTNRRSRNSPITPRFNCDAMLDGTRRRRTVACAPRDAAASSGGSAKVSAKRLLPARCSKQDRTAMTDRPLREWHKRTGPDPRRDTGMAEALDTWDSPPDFDFGLRIPSKRR
jgi:hypothetical protein